MHRTTSALAPSSRNAAASMARSSPTVVWRRTSKPSDPSRSARKAALVSTIWPVRTSSPVERISQRKVMWEPRGQDQGVEAASTAGGASGGAGGRRDGDDRGRRGEVRVRAGRGPAEQGARPVEEAAQELDARLAGAARDREHLLADGRVDRRGDAARAPPRVTTSPLRKSTAGARPRSIAASIEERSLRYRAPTARRSACLATRPGLPAAQRSASVSAIQSRSSVPETFSSRTPSARATRTVSVMISSVRRRTKRWRISAPSLSPPTVPREEMAQLIASFDHRAPARLAVTLVGADRFEEAPELLQPPVRRAVEAAEDEAAGRGPVVHAGLHHRRAPRDDRAEGALRAGDGGDALLAEAVLEADHRAARREHRQRAAGRVLHLRRLCGEQDVVEGRAACGELADGAASHVAPGSPRRARGSRACRSRRR